MSESTSHYETLKIARDAAPAALRAAYRRAAQQHHPDRHAGAAAAQEAMARINEAYAVLSHPQRRASYDSWLRAMDARRRAHVAVQASQPSRLARTRPWGIVAATLAFTALSVGTVLYKSATTTPAPAPMHGAQVAGSR